VLNLNAIIYVIVLNVIFCVTVLNVERLSFVSLCYTLNVIICVTVLNVECLLKYVVIGSLKETPLNLFTTLVKCYHLCYSVEH